VAQHPIPLSGWGVGVASDIKQRLTELHSQGVALAPLLRTRKQVEAFGIEYQRWYSAALLMVKSLGPERLAEFRSYYEFPPRRKWVDHDTWCVQDYLTGNEPSTHTHCRFDCGRETRRCVRDQLAILDSLQGRADWRVSGMAEQILVDLLESNLKTAQSLLRYSNRAAAALAGSVLETYLRRVALQRRVKLRSQKPDIHHLADALKDSGLMELDTWRQTRWLADLWRRCESQEREPNILEARDLIDGVGWVIKNVF
jgi:hypothetical protein